MSIYRNNNGNISLLLCFSSLLVGLCFSFYTLFSNSQQQMNFQYTCQKHILSLQNLYSKLANKLIKMNPIAKKLRTEEKMAKAAILAAQDPASKSLALQYYRNVKARQKIFRFKQEVLIRTYYSKVVITQNHFRYQNKNINKQVLPYRLYFKAIPKKSDSPSYIPEKNILHKQMARFSWKNKNLQGECKASIRKEEKWHAFLIEDKVLSKL